MGALADWVSQHAPVTVLSGAGISTESGIPDYRGPSGSLRQRAPMTIQRFRSGPAERRRYWARAHVGWAHMTGAQPNPGHLAVAALERAGLLDGVVTQNVDGLHQAAGTRSVIDLHGSVHRVRCMDCDDVRARSTVERRLDAANPGWAPRLTRVLADGDAEIPDAEVERFAVVGCERCDGPLIPDVVFFGDTVPAARVEAAFETVEGGKGLLVLGSSLTVMSGFRFVLRAAKLGLPVAIVNQGVTRGDRYAELLVDAPLGATLTDAVAALTVPA